MFDIKRIREDPDGFDRAMARRGLPPVSAEILETDERLRTLLTELQDAQARRNTVSKEIGQVKAQGGDAEALIAEMGDLKTRIQEGETEQRRLEAEIEDKLAGLPNIPADDVPDGEDENANTLVRTAGTVPSFDFEPKDHVDLGEGLGLMDFETAGRMAGARFVVTRGALARMERALATFMLNLHTGEFGYEEVSPPLLVRDAAMFGTGQLPKFGEDSFQTTDGYWLIPTAEVALTNLVREQILAAGDLPLRLTGHTPCFRSEAGAAGKDTRGMIRQHQFYKVELVSITKPEESDAEHERMLSCAEEVLKRLDLPYRVMKLSTGDMGFSARRTYDIEVWMPGQDCYREISSCSTCGDFQARRMKARYRPAEGESPVHVHTLNGSGLAVGRTLIAIMENYQQPDGSIVIPEALRPLMGGQDRITAQG